MIFMFMHKIKFLICFMIVALLLGFERQSVSAQASDPYDIVAAENNFRAASGLPQLHSDYRALIEAVTHFGAGGSRAKDWAYAAGFGGGVTIYISDDVETQSDAPTYRDDLFIVSTPQDDGAIIHIVEAGQSLIGIALTYEVPVNDLLVYNNLTLDSVIYVGDKIIIVPGITPSPTISPTEPEPTVTPSITVTVYKPSPTPRASFTPRPTIPISPTASPEKIESSGRDNLVLGVVLVALLIFIVVIVIGLFRGK